VLAPSDWEPVVAPIVLVVPPFRDMPGAGIAVDGVVGAAARGDADIVGAGVARAAAGLN